MCVHPIDTHQIARSKKTKSTAKQPQINRCMSHPMKLIADTTRRNHKGIMLSLEQKGRLASKAALLAKQAWTNPISLNGHHDVMDIMVCACLRSQVALLILVLPTSWVTRAGKTCMGLWVVGMGLSAQPSMAQHSFTIASSG